MQRRSTRPIVALAGWLVALMLLGGVPQAAASVSAAGSSVAAAAVPDGNRAADGVVVPARALPLSVLGESESVHVLADDPPSTGDVPAFAAGDARAVAARAALRLTVRPPLRVARLHLFCVYRL